MTANKDVVFEHTEDAEDQKMEEENKLLTEISENNIDYGLNERHKHQKLTIQQKQFIKVEIENSGLTNSQISKRYWISPSLVSKIKRESLDKLNGYFINSVTKIWGKNKDEIINEMIKFSNQSMHSFTASDMTMHINTKFNSNYSCHFIRKYMKNAVGLRYKKIKSRPHNIDFAKIGCTRRYFALKFAQIVNKKHLIINIDESWFNRNLKNNYSWVLKGQTNEAKSIQFSGSWNIVMTIWSNGATFTLLSNEATDSVKFWLFLENLNSWINNNRSFGFSETLLIMDNWSIHKSKSTKAKLWKINANVLYLPAYSPDFAPIEMCFSILKRKFKAEWNNQHIKLNSKQSYHKIVDALQKIKPFTIKQLFKRLYSEIQSYLRIN